MEYRRRILDDILDLHMETFGATQIKGPKGCGKTTTARQKCRTVVEFQNEDVRKSLLLTADTAPSLLLKGEKPILFDEWQDAPKIWGAIRKDVDDSGETGQYLLTGSSSRRVITPHTGTLRISTLIMRPMSLFESGESNGTVSLKRLFDAPEEFEGCVSDLSVEHLIFALCRGGWPATLSKKTERSQLLIAREVFNKTCDEDISNMEGEKKDSKLTRAILHSYARNICTLADTKSILDDVSANFDVSERTVYSYIASLSNLFILDDIEAWCPAIRSKSSIRSRSKRNFIDPSIAVAAHGLRPEHFYSDFQSLGFLFESLCIRDLKVYSSEFNGYISYYHDRYGLEADAVLHLSDSRYALIEFKLGEKEIEKGAANLCKIERLIDEHNEGRESGKIRKPDLKLVITAGKTGYRRPDGVFVIPIGCLRD